MNHVRDQVWHSPDLVEQIFSWLPPRSTLQFRRLAKRFNQYLTSPYFTRLNLTRCIERRCQSFHPSTDHILFWPEEAKYSSAFSQLFLFSLRELKATLEPVSPTWRLRIPKAINNLHNLMHLDLNSSGLTGEIPIELCTLIQLEHLNLHNNELTGPIPIEIGQLVQLKVLYLGLNAISGPIPSSVGNLTHLTILNLFDNQLEGNLPPEICNLSSLQCLHLQNNRIHGPIPSEIGQLQNLHVLNLSKNRLCGEIPATLWNLTNLKTLSLAENELTGHVGGNGLTRLFRLRTIDMKGNRFDSVCVPGEFFNLEHLRWSHF
ncbi:hypothetical protein HDU77_010669 [Chytriomyces hyalinus]|nr:hypothetical protein HDU77_010669 [Chytriomyces hyalinus]